jgi:hypothetical protein
VGWGRGWGARFNEHSDRQFARRCKLKQLAFARRAGSTGLIPDTPNRADP